LEGELPVDEAVEIASERGVTLGVVEHGGRGQPIDDDASMDRYVQELAPYKVYRGIQAEGLDWAACFSEDALAGLDFVLSDALTFPEQDGRLVRLWTPEAQIEDAQDFMERYVDFHLQVMATPIDIMANFSFLPDAILDQYDALWTEERMDRVIAAAVEHGVAIEINARYCIPSAKYLQRARVQGARFTFGSNYHGADVGQLDYCVRMVQELGLTRADIWMPERPV
jgi:histidinol phosphatase-like PHP family hydrolase